MREPSCGEVAGVGIDCSREVVRVKVTRKFVMPDGNIKDENELTGGEKRKFAQKIVDAFTPLWYEEVMKDVQKERDKKESE